MILIPTQSHLLQCPLIMEKLRFMVDFKSLNYDMIFVSIAKQLKIAKDYAKKVNRRNSLQSRTRAQDRLTKSYKCSYYPETDIKYVPQIWYFLHIKWYFFTLNVM